MPRATTGGAGPALLAGRLVRSIGAGAVGVALAGCLGARTVPSPADGDAADAAAIRAADIRFYEARVRRDPQGALDRARLAALHLAAGRAGADEPALARAAALAESSLALRGRRNELALQVLASARLAQHRFAEALAAAEHLAAAAPDQPARRALVGEVLLELGREAEARSQFAGVSGVAADASTLARLARWHELEGRLAAADDLLRRAEAAADAAYGSDAETRAWFALRRAEFLRRHGRLRDARRVLARAEAAGPSLPAVLLAAGRLALDRRAWGEAERYGTRAFAAAPVPEALAVLAAAARGAGDTAAAARRYAALEAVARDTTVPWHRGWGEALLDAGRAAPLVAARCTADLAVRRDRESVALCARALAAAGRPADAAALRAGEART